MKTKLLLFTLGLVAMFLVEVGYSLGLQGYETGSRQQSFFRGPFSFLLVAGARKAS